MYKRRIRWRNDKFKGRAGCRRVLSGKSGTGQGLKRRRKKKGVSSTTEVNKRTTDGQQGRADRNAFSVNLCSSSQQTHTSVTDNQRNRLDTDHFQGLLGSQSWFMHHSCFDKQCLPRPCHALPYDIYAVTCNSMQRIKCDAHEHSHTSIWRKKNTPDHQIFADKFDEDTGGMEGQGEGAEERRELTGTSFQYQRVGHCQRGGGDRKKRKTGR